MTFFPNDITFYLILLLSFPGANKTSLHVDILNGIVDKIIVFCVTDFSVLTFCLASFPPVCKQLMDDECVLNSIKNCRRCCYGSVTDVPSLFDCACVICIIESGWLYFGNSIGEHVVYIQYTPHIDVHC